MTELLAELGAAAPTLWRPPYGRLLRGASAAIAAERGLLLAGWTISSDDWEGRDGATMHAAVAPALAAQEHAVVLLHDGHRESGPVPRRPDASNTVELVRLLLEDGDCAFAPLHDGLAANLVEGPPRALAPGGRCARKSSACSGGGMPPPGPSNRGRRTGAPRRWSSG